MKILVLWTVPSGYLFNALGALAQEGFEVHLIAMKQSTSTNFEFKSGASKLKSFSFIEDLTLQEITRFIEEVGMDIIFVCGWHIKIYKKILKNFSGLKILYVDRGWFGNTRQILAVVLRKILIKPFFDFAFIPGERQHQFMRRLGFPNNRIRTGALTADSKIFVNQKYELTKVFLYAGRLSSEKGYKELLDGYNMYQSSVSHPWELQICGLGNEEKAELNGVAYLGFVQPSELATIMNHAGAFIMPSKKEAWGVAIHEALSCGLPVICTQQCGCVPELVQDGWNGIVIPKCDPKMIADALLRMHNIDDEQRKIMSRHAEEISSRYTTDLWVQNFRYFTDFKNAI